MSAKLTLAWLPDGRTAAILSVPGDLDGGAAEVGAQFRKVWTDGPVLVLTGPNVGDVDVEIIQAPLPEVAPVPLEQISEPVQLSQKQREEDTRVLEISVPEGLDLNVVRSMIQNRVAALARHG